VRHVTTGREKMSGRRSFKDPLRILGHGHDTKDFEVETLHKRAVSNGVEVQEGLMIMISKLVEMTRLLSHLFSGFASEDSETCSRLSEEVREQSHILTKALVPMLVGDQSSNGLIRLPFLLKRVGHMLANILECYRTKNLARITFSDKARREQEQIFSLLLDILTNLRDALHNSSREALLAVLFQDKRLEVTIQEFAVSHWERVKSGVCPVEASTMWPEILDSTKCANQYVMEMAANLLELGKPQSLLSHS
jgi:Na+/phosphate symporter